MQIDKEKVRELPCKHTGWCEAARRAEEEMDAALREARAVMDEMAEYLDQVNAADKAMEEELERLRKAEAERKDASEAGAALHTCGECLSWAEDKMEFNGTGTCLNRNCETVKRGEMDPSCIYFEPREEPGAKTGKPTEEGPEVSCMECKHAVRKDVRTNTWHCSKGLAFIDFAKVRCSEYEEMPQESGTEELRMCGTCKYCQPRGADPDIVECDHPTVGTIHIGRWSDACDKYEEAKP